MTRKKIKTKIVRELRVDDSTNIESLGYDDATMTLQVRFKTSGDRYRYYGVSPFDFTDLVNAHSIGKAFNETIKDNFPRRKLTSR